MRLNFLGFTVLHTLLSKKEFLFRVVLCFEVAEEVAKVGGLARVLVADDAVFHGFLPGFCLFFSLAAISTFGEMYDSF